MNQRTKKAEYLLDEIGNIDEEIITLAMPSFSGKRKTTGFRAVFAAAAAVAVIACAAVGVFLVGRMSEDSHDGKNTQTDIQEQTVDELLSRAKSSPLTECFASRGDIDLFDGKTKIVWSESSSEEYYVIEVTSKSRKETLSKALSDTFESSVELTEHKRVESRIWITYGDGRVISPCLDNSEGNVGYGEIFDYSAEIVPSDSFVKLIDALISE